MVAAPSLYMTPFNRMAAALGRVAQAGLDLVLPVTCPGCDAPGPWCESCAETLAGLPRAVVVPPLSLDRMATAGLAMPRVYALARYRGPVRRAIIAGKAHGLRRLPRDLGRDLAAGLIALQRVGALPEELWLVPAPTKRSAARARGGDPVLAMVRAAAGEISAAGRGVGVAPCLYSGRRVRDSVGLDARGRAENLVGSVRFDPRGRPPDGAAVVLVDDVFTTGATTVASSLALAERGYSVRAAVVLAAAGELRSAVFGHAPAGVRRRGRTSA